jgi:hypothetical protein
MKRLFALLFFAAVVFPAAAQDYVAFELIDGIGEGALKSKMETQVSRLLTAINTAERTGESVNFRNVDIDDMASHSIAMMWENVHFRTFDDDIITHCLTLSGNGRVRGYQVRDIEIEMKPLDETYTDSKVQEICIDFDRNGRIVDFNLTLGVNQYMRIMREGLELDDLDRRLEILHYVEQFRNAYNQKDINFMEAIFSEDALIITGKVIRRVPNEGTVSLKPEVRYSKQSKQQYLANLKRCFARQGYINVKFDDVKVMRSGYNRDFYGVTLIQHWNSSTYSDEGILFLVWNFENPDEPQINVRTWQPMETDKDEIFTLDKFKY